MDDGIERHKRIPLPAMNQQVMGILVYLAPSNYALELPHHYSKLRVRKLADGR